MFSQRTRETVFPAIDPYVRTASGSIPDFIIEGEIYTAYQLNEKEYVGTVWTERGVADVIDWLERHGYSYNGLAAAKRHPDDRSIIDSGSFRKVPDEHPSGLDPKIGIINDWRPIDCQYHVHIFPSEDGGVVDIYSHYEVRPDFTEPEFDLARKRVHKHPTWDRPHRDKETWTYLRGVACEDVTEFAG